MFSQVNEPDLVRNAPITTITVGTSRNTVT